METFNIYSAKILQGLPKQTANVAGVYCMGWKMMQATIDMMVMKFIWRLLLLPMTNIYKIILLTKLYEA